MDADLFQKYRKKAKQLILFHTQLKIFHPSKKNFTPIKTILSRHQTKTPFFQHLRRYVSKFDHKSFVYDFRYPRNNQKILHYRN
jgi:hypothetical protein